MMDHDGFGPACGSRRIHHVGQVVGCDAGVQVVIWQISDAMRIGVEAEGLNLSLRKTGQQPLLSQDNE